VKYLLDVTTLAYKEELCTGCKKCTEVCPHGVFAMENKKARFIDRDRCMECGACALNCDSMALTVETGVGCSAAILKSMITGSPATCGCDSPNSGGCC